MKRFLILGTLLLAIIILPKFIGQKVAPASSVLVNAETSWRLPSEDFNADLTGETAVATNTPGELENTVRVAASGTFLSQSRNQLGRIMWPAQHFFQSHRILFLCLNLAFFLVMLTGITIAVALQRFTLARRLAEKGFRLGSNEVLLICIITILAHLGGLNFLAGVHYLIWLVPVLGVMLFAGLLLLIDMNYPVWNATFSSVGMPVLSAVLVLEWSHIAALLKRFSR